MVQMASPRSRSQILRVLSFEAEITREGLGSATTTYTEPVCPCNARHGPRVISSHTYRSRLLCFAIPGVYMILLDPILPSCKKGSTSDAASYCGSRSRGDGPRGHLSGSL